MKTSIKNLVLLAARIACVGLMLTNRAAGQTFTTLYSFSSTSGNFPTNSDGANPHAGLILSGNTLYGAAYRGGSSGYGTVFAVKTDGSSFAILNSFTNNSESEFVPGSVPYA